MRLEGGDGLGLASLGVACLGLTTIDIHAAAIALTQEVERLAVSTHYGIAVLASMCRHVRMLTALGVVEPYIACNGRSVMLAPLVFIALAILIVETLAVGRKADHLSRRAQHLQRATTLDRHLIQFRQAAGGEHHALCRVLDAGIKDNPLPVGCESLRLLSHTLICQTGGRTSVSRHHKDVEVAVSVAGKGNLLAVGTPYGSAFVTDLCRQLDGCSALG